VFRRRRVVRTEPVVYEERRPRGPGLLARLFGAVASLVWWLLVLAILVIAVIVILAIL
jgi:hypothetical protein